MLLENRLDSFIYLIKKLAFSQKKIVESTIDIKGLLHAIF
jgi:hypothetical protein